jgi:hypothetical protein
VTHTLHPATLRVGARVFLFFNPMWLHLGEHRGAPPGTYFYDQSELVNYWRNVFGQAMVRPALLDRCDGERVGIPTEVAETSLPRENGRPNPRDFLDHLPLVFELEL